MSDTTLSDFQRRKLLHKFKLLDIDQNGLIEFQDFQHVIDVLAEQRGWGTGDAQFERLTASNRDLWMALQSFCDVGEDGSIAPEQWLEYHAQAFHHASEFDQLVPGFETTLDAFTAFVGELLDSDGDGLVREEDYLSLAKAHSIEEGQAKKTFSGIDKNQDGALSLDELSALVRQFYLSDDANAPGNELFGKF
jgi:Ca2+-binding EF-hand superfamily protein